MRGGNRTVSFFGFGDRCFHSIRATNEIQDPLSVISLRQEYLCSTASVPNIVPSICLPSFSQSNPQYSELGASLILQDLYSCSDIYTFCLIQQLMDQLLFVLVFPSLLSLHDFRSLSTQYSSIESFPENWPSVTWSRYPIVDLSTCKSSLCSNTFISTPSP